VKKIALMTESIAEQCAAEIVEELIVYNKIKMNVKNLWIGKILDHWILQQNRQGSLPESERVFYNLFQHSKVMDAVRSLNTGNGIESLLSFLSHVDNSPIQKTLINKQEEEQKLSGAALRAEWEKEFNTMTTQQKMDKCSAWLTCGCPKASIPTFVFDHIKTLDDALKERMRGAYKVGQDKVSYWSKGLVGNYSG
jgi:hypothetical protein